jgi:hypothetical protein
MPQRTLGQLVIFSFLLVQLCTGKQLANVTTTEVRGLRGAVHTVLEKTFVYGDDGNKSPGVSRRFTYDRSGYEVESNLYDSRGALRSQRLCRPINNETGAAGKHVYHCTGAGTTTITNDSQGHVKPTVSTVKLPDGSVTTIESFPDGSFRERTVRPDGTVLTHAHFREPSAASANNYGDWYQTVDASNRPLEYIEDTRNGYMRSLTRYDTAGRGGDIRNYDRSGKLLGQSTFKYLLDDAYGNWTEFQIWVLMAGEREAKLHQVTRRTITYYGNDGDGGR